MLKLALHDLFHAPLPVLQGMGSDLKNEKEESYKKSRGRIGDRVLRFTCISLSVGVAIFIRCSEVLVGVRV